MNDVKREIVEIPVDDIVPNRFQPRLTFDMDALNELANSIKEHGIIQPLVVRRLQDKYEIIAGERRFKASTLIGMQKVPCIIMDLNDNESAEVAVIENIQRKEMTPLEEAKSFKKILDRGYLTQEELAKRMGKSQSAVSNKLRLLNLDEIVQDAILNGKISERHARSLLKIDSKQDQRNILNEIIEKRLTVRQLDDLIKERYGKDDKVIEQETNTNNSDNIFKTPVVETPKEEILDVYPSMPNVVLPSGIGNNPQFNLIEDVNKRKDNFDNNQISNDIFKTVSTSDSNIEKMNIKDIINPSVLSSNSNLGVVTDSEIKSSIPSELNKNNDINNIIKPEVINTTSSYNDMFNIDINDIKNIAQDILPKEETKVDMNSLLSSDKQENKFFVDLNVKEEDLTTNSLSFKVQSAVDSINRKVDEIKFQGNKIVKEEKDLGNIYEIIIRIEK